MIFIVSINVVSAAQELTCIYDKDKDNWTIMFQQSSDGTHKFYVNTVGGTSITGANWTELEIKKTIDFKIATTKAAKILGFESTQETFTRGDSHIVATYEISGYFLVIYIEMSKPLIDVFDFEKFNDKIELILIELKTKIDRLLSDKDDDI